MDRPHEHSKIYCPEGMLGIIMLANLGLTFYLSTFFIKDIRPAITTALLILNLLGSIFMLCVSRKLYHDPDHQDLQNCDRTTRFFDSVVKDLPITMPLGFISALITISLALTKNKTAAQAGLALSILTINAAAQLLCYNCQSLKPISLKVPCLQDRPYLRL